MIRSLPDGRRLRFNMCDTVLFDNGRVVAHSFTNKSGEVMKKKNCTRDGVREKVRAIPRAIGRREEENTANHKPTN